MHKQKVKSDLGGHSMAGVEDGFVIVLRSLIEAVSTSFTISHLKYNRQVISILIMLQLYFYIFY